MRKYWDVRIYLRFSEKLYATMARYDERFWAVTASLLDPCQARYKLSSLLPATGDYDVVRDVSRENLQCLHEMLATASLVVRHNINFCAIAMRRRRLDHAMEVFLTCGPLSDGMRRTCVRETKR